MEHTKNKTLTRKIVLGLIILLLIPIALQGARFIQKTYFPSCVKGLICGKKVSCEFFNKILERQTVSAKMQYGQLFENFKPLLNLKEQSWEKLILLTEAKQRGIKVSNQDVIVQITQNENFYKNGQFNDWLYKNILRNALGTSPRVFEESVRDSLIIEKLYEHVTQNTTIDETAVLSAYRMDQEKISGQYITISPEETNLPVPDDQKLAEYLAARLEDFRKPETIQLEYITLDFPEDGGIQKQVEMKYKAKAIIDQFTRTKDLAASAQALKFTLQTTEFVSRKDITEILPDWPLALIMEVFEMRKQELKEPYKIEDKGYVIIRLKDRKASYLPKLAEVKTDVLSVYQKETAIEQTLKTASGIYEQIQQAQTTEQFTELTKNLGHKPEDLDLMSKQQAVLTLDLKNEAKINIEQINKPGTVVPPLLSESGARILFVKEFQPFLEEEFQKQKSEYNKRLVNAEKDKVFEKFLKEIRLSGEFYY